MSHTVSTCSIQGAPGICVAVEVDLADRDTFLFSYIGDRDATCIFVRTTCPEAPGTQLNLRFTDSTCVPACPLHAEPGSGQECDLIPGLRGSSMWTVETPTAPLVLDGQVIWINPYRPDDNNNLSPGMGIRLLDMSADQRTQLFHMVKCLAFLADDPRSHKWETPLS